MPPWVQRQRQFEILAHGHSKRCARAAVDRDFDSGRRRRHVARRGALVLDPQGQRHLSSMMAKAGALVTTAGGPSPRAARQQRVQRRRHVGGLFNMSCTCPSVTGSRPAMRARGSSASASDSAVIRRRARCRARRHAPPRATRCCRSARSRPRSVRQRGLGPGRPVGEPLEALSSTTASTMSVSGSRSSRLQRRVGRAARTASAASPRSHQPDSPRHSRQRDGAASDGQGAQKRQRQKRVEDHASIRGPYSPAGRAAPAHAPGRICSCRSAHA